jgi:hypothetical protein
MCGMNLVANAYYYEWMLVATTNAYWALTQNLAAAQRRGVGSTAS